MVDIPGYFYDEEKNRHFKIMPTGPYSAAAINQRKREREREQQQQQKQQVRSTKRRHPLDTSSLLEFHHNRSSLPRLSLRSMVGYGAKSIYKQLTPVGSMSLSHFGYGQYARAPLPQIDNMAVNMLPCDINQQLQNNGGDILVGYQGGLITRYGCQVDPFFQVWATSQAWQCGSSITSLHFGGSYRERGHWKQTVVGTSMGQDRHLSNRLWRASLPLAPPLDELATERLILNHAEGSIRANVLDQSTLPRPSVVASFIKPKDTFWSSFVADEQDVTLVGGERQLYVLSRGFDVVSQVPSKSAIFTTCLVDQQPQLAWIGRRDGRIVLVDTRQKPPPSLQHALHFYLSSAVTHVKPLADSSSGHTLVAGAMDGSLCLLDTRLSIPSSSSSSQRAKKGRPHRWSDQPFSTPIRRFYGHTNDHSRNLAFDVDINLNLMVMAGADNVLRMWSLEDQNDEVHPFWSSTPYSGQVCQASILSSVETSDRIPLMKRFNPGLLVCAPTPSLDWFSIP